MTLRQSVVTPLSSLPKCRCKEDSLIHYLYVDHVYYGHSSHCVWGFVLGDPILSKTDFSGPSLVVVGIMLPFGILLGILIWASLLHLSLSIVRGATRDFEATLRLVCYSSGPDLFKAIPYIGPLVSIVWRVYVTIVAIREVHRISTGLAGSFLCRTDYSVLRNYIRTGDVPNHH